MGERVGQIAKVPEVKQSNSNFRVRRTEHLRSMDTPVDRILFLQRTAGNQAVSRLMKSGALQAKLRIGQPGDVYEQEADRVADAVMRMPEPQVRRQPIEEEEEEQMQTKPFTDQITPLVQRQVEEEEEEQVQTKPVTEQITPLVQRQIEEEEEEELQTKSTSGSIPEVQPDIESHIQSLKGGGQPLSKKDRTFFEPRFGRDFSQVRVHTDANAAEAAGAVNARAFTVGQDIVFGTGEYAPRKALGQKLLSHELVHVVQQTDSSVRARTHGSSLYPKRQEAELTSQAVKLPIRLKSTPIVIMRAVSSKLRKRIKLCIDPFYYDDKGQYRWLKPKPDCSDMKIPSDRKRAWKCVNKMYWSPDGKKWDWFGSEPNCSNLSLPVPLHEARAESPEEQARRKEEERRIKIVEANRNYITAIRDKSSSDVEALARMFTDAKIKDDGTIPGRVHVILDATEHRVIPGLQTGIKFKQSGFRKEFHDPWKSSINQVGHFLTAVRLAFDPGVVTHNPILLTILGAWGDKEIPLRLIIGHEKEPDPGIFEMSVGFKAQYRSTTETDIKNFKAGNLGAIKVGKGKGNSMADLLLSHKGWVMGRWIAKGLFKTKEEIADWIRSTIGTLKK